MSAYAIVEDDLVCYSHLWGTAFNATLDPIVIAVLVGMFFLVRYLLVATFLRSLAVYMMFGTELNSAVQTEGRNEAIDGVQAGNEGEGLATSDPSSARRNITAENQADLDRWIKYFWHMLVYASFSAYNYYALFTSPWGFKVNEMVDWPHPISESYQFKPFLFLQLCWYIHGLGEMFLHDRKRGDMAMMILHHALAIYLIFFSWYANMARLAISVTAVQDAVDVFIYVMKLCHKSANMKALQTRPVQLVLLTATTTVWWIARVMMMICINYITWFLIPKTCADHWLPASLRIQLGVNLGLQITWAVGISKMCLSLWFKGSFHDNVHEKEKDMRKED